MRLLSAAQKIISQPLQIDLLPFHNLSPNPKVQYLLTKSTKLKLKGVQADVLVNSNLDRRQIKLVKTCVFQTKVVKV